MNPQISTHEDIDTSYEPFSLEPEYLEANRLFLDALPWGKTRRILDLACGTGTLTDLLSGLAATRLNTGTPVEIVGLDLSRESLTYARQKLIEGGVLGNGTPPSHAHLHSLGLMEGTAEIIPLADQSVDFVIMGNAIQLVPNLDHMLAEIYRVLRPGGHFGFNTSFYAGTYCPGTEQVYLRWIQEAVTWMRRRDQELKAQGLPGIPRKKGEARQAFSTPWLAADDYSARLAAQGLHELQRHERTVMLTQSSFETIGAYTGLAKVLLSGYPPKLASEALVRGAAPTLEAVGLREVPRYWLELIARKSPH